MQVDSLRHPNFNDDTKKIAETVGANVNIVQKFRLSLRCKSLLHGGLEATHNANGWSLHEARTILR